MDKQELSLVATEAKCFWKTSKTLFVSHFQEIIIITIKRKQKTMLAQQSFFSLYGAGCHNEGKCYNKLNGFPFNNSSSPGLSSQFLSGVKLAWNFQRVPGLAERRPSRKNEVAKIERQTSRKLSRLDRLFVLIGSDWKLEYKRKRWRRLIIIIIFLRLDRNNTSIDLWKSISLWVSVITRFPQLSKMRVGWIFGSEFEVLAKVWYRSITET